MPEELTAKQIFDNMFGRIKTMKKFVVERIMDDLPYHGVLPFDVQHTKGQPYRIFVYAVTQEEAELKVEKWLNGVGDDE